MIRKLFILVLLVLAVDVLPSGASHIVGGEMMYECLGRVVPGTIRYRVWLNIYQDCLGGHQDAIGSDNPGIFAIFDGNGSRVTMMGRIYDEVQSSEDIAIPPNFHNECVNNPPPVCLRRVKFERIYDLPDNSTGYHIVYQRCCRNASVINISNPGNTGATYSCFIPPVLDASVCNSSAVFKNYPPQIICINNPLVYDHSAVDPDGDSLSYEFCQAYIGGSLDFPKPGAGPGAGDILPPPYPSVTYIGGFNADRPMVGNPPIQIDPVTGLISGTPNLMGRFVVTVCVKEWRDGAVINTVTREFQFVVTNCSKAVVADIPQLSTEFNTYIVNCDGYTVKFKNNSTGGFNYYWDFGVGDETPASSTDFEPSFTYPDTGVYTVKLVVNRGSTCPDSITRFVKVYPYFQADFDTEGRPCPKGIIQFRDQSKATYEPVKSWFWSFGDGNSSNLQNPTHTYAAGGNYPVTLISQSIKGCVDTIQRIFAVDKFQPFAGNDTIIVKGSSLRFNASGGAYYTWSPGTYLDDISGPNPLGYFPDTTRLDYIVYVRSENDCEGYDTINVWVVGQAAAFLPTAFSPNGDGMNDVFTPIGIGYSDVKFFRIVNRFGEEVFFADRFKTGWDGTYKGEPAPDGTYFWVIKIVDRFGKEEVLKGDVTLLR